ncbi:MAG: type II toxin-antitoxin system HicB family antitoxin [Oceanicaulis sp.]
MVDPKQYTYRVVWSQEDGEFVGLCAEFPSLSWLAATQTEALEGVVALVAEIASEMAGNSEPVPEPLSARTFSGKFQVRLPPQQHRRLAIKAAEEGVSLNRLVSSMLNA